MICTELFPYLVSKVLEHKLPELRKLAKKEKKETTKDFTLFGSDSDEDECTDMLTEQLNKSEEIR